MKSYALLIVIALNSGMVFSQGRYVYPDGSVGRYYPDSGGSGMFGAPDGIRAAERDAQQLQQMQLQYQQQQLLLQQQRQLENQRLQNELLQKKLEQEQSTAQTRQTTPQVDYSKSPEFQTWRAANPWYGSDRAKSEYALLYAKQLQRDQPNLSGRPFLDAVAAKVAEVFGAQK